MTRQRQPAAERRQQIAHAALHILATTGVHRLTTLELARAVGVSDASLFKHFANKEAIISAAIDTFEGYLQQSIDAAAGERDPVQRLRSFFVHRLDLVRANPDILQLAFNDRLLEAGGAAEADRVRAIVARSRHFLIGCIQEAQAAGAVRADLPAEALVWVAAGVMRGAALSPDALLRSALGPDGTTPEIAWQSLARLLNCAP